MKRSRRTLEAYGEVQPGAGIELLIILHVKSVGGLGVIAHESAEGDLLRDRAGEREAEGIQQISAVNGRVMRELAAIKRLQNRVAAEPPTAAEHKAVVGAVVEIIGITRRRWHHRRWRGSFGGAVIAVGGDGEGDGFVQEKFAAHRPTRNIFAVEFVVITGIQQPAVIAAEGENPVLPAPRDVAKNS